MRINLCTCKRHPNYLLLFIFLFLGPLMNGQTIISGRITLPDGVTPIPGVGVVLDGPENDATLTDSNGEYTFSVTPGSTYSVRPFADLNPLNGVSTFDHVLIRRHILGQELLNSPYKIIAADVDDSENITFQDTLIIRNLILGITTQFPSGDSWRFVPANHVFVDPANPFPYPQTITVNNISSNQLNLNFYGVKLGDVNYTAVLVPGGQVEGPFYSRIVGNVKRDDNSNCSNDPQESPLGNWLVVASGLPGEFVTRTRTDGSYTIPVPDGNYTVSLIKPNGLWNVCTAPQPVTVGLVDTVIVPFSGQADKLCGRMEVDLSTGFLRRCFPSYYTVQYCNQGTVPVSDAYVEVTLDPYLTYTSSTIPYSTNTGNTYTFPVGNLDAGECRLFFIDVEVSCEAELGQTHCSSAHVYPDSSCVPLAQGLWDGSNLRVSGHCNGNEVNFTITNEGEDMTEPAEYVIIEDIMIQMTSDPIQLNSGAAETVTRPANGSTWRVEINQADNYPYGIRASAAVEGCGTNESGGVSQGFITLFPQDDAAFYEDEDCSENTGSFDPNDKQGFPKGVGAEHFIPRDEEIEYLIRFQNTGTDTAFTVMIRDTISALFDLSTLRTGASSHPYQFSLSGQGVAQFFFQNIMLPDSNVNEAASHGFVKFTISPKTGLPDNTQLENQAGIYFDFNEPVITNRTLHTIGENYLEVTQVVDLQEGVALEVFPNPASTEATFRFNAASPATEGHVLWYDMQGRLIKSQAFSGNTFKVDVSNLPTGQYYFLLRGNNGNLSSGKVTVSGKR